ncbi:hypothetical protein FBQ98_02425 [Gammaproteobacteria bacterium PRO6]|nr:hypothetical protein [Gammaproteobacteria bacterium PRO6]
MKVRMVMATALAASCGTTLAQSTRPATMAERLAAGFNDRTQMVMVRDAATTTARRSDSVAGGPSARFQTRLGVSFSGTDSNYAYTGANSVQCTSDTNPFATANLDLPDGALIDWVDVFGQDHSTTDNLTLFLVSTCATTGSMSPPTFTVLGDVSSSGDAGNFFHTIVLNPPVSVDRFSCKYALRSRFTSSTTGPCVGFDMILDKVRVQYHLPE